MDLKIRELEIEFIKYLRNSSSVFWDTIMQGITILGEKNILIFILAFIFFIYDKKIGQTIAYTIFTSLLVNNTIKGIVKYVRPFTYDPEVNAVRTETATGYSFPSGHTQNAATLYPSIIYNCKFKLKTKKILWIVVIALTFLIGFSRVFLGVHYPKDVIVGLILGYSLTFLCPFILRKCHDEFKQELILFVITLIVFLPFIFIFYQKDYITIKLYRDFYLCYALFAGYVASYVLDFKFVNYTCNTKLSKRIIRLLGAIVVFAIIEYGLKFIFGLIIPDGSIVLDFIRYFLITFMILGIYPLIFKNNLFKD